MWCLEQIYHEPCVGEAYVTESGNNAGSAESKDNIKFQVQFEV